MPQSRFVKIEVHYYHPPALLTFLPAVLHNKLASTSKLNIRHLD